MALTNTGGSVTVTVHPVTGLPVFNGGGLALALAQAQLGQSLLNWTPSQRASIASQLATPPPAPTTPPNPPAPEGTAAMCAASLLAYYRIAEQSANAYGPAIVNHILANAEVAAGTFNALVTTESLGRTPNPNNPDTAIFAPLLDVGIPVVGSGSIT